MLQPQGKHSPIKLIIINQHKHKRNELRQAKSSNNPSKRLDKELPNKKTLRNRRLKKVMIFQVLIIFQFLQYNSIYKLKQYVICLSLDFLIILQIYSFSYRRFVDRILISTRYDDPIFIAFYSSNDARSKYHTAFRFTKILLSSSRMFE